MQLQHREFVLESPDTVSRFQELLVISRLTFFPSMHFSVTFGLKRDVGILVRLNVGIIGRCNGTAPWHVSRTWVLQKKKKKKKVTVSSQLRSGNRHHIKLRIVL